METQPRPASFFRGTTARKRRIFRTRALLLEVLLVFFFGRDAAGTQVIGGNMTVVQGGTFVFPCKLTGTDESLTQISWKRQTRNSPMNGNFFTVLPMNDSEIFTKVNGRFKFVGSFADRNGSLRLSNVSLLDEGVYRCIFTLFPSGNHHTDIPLNVLVPPKTSVEGNHHVVGDEEVALANCTAAGSKPPAAVEWHTGSLAGKLRTTTNSTKYDDGTTTTISSLFGVPTREINQNLVDCIITSAAPPEEKTLHFNIQIYFAPMQVNISETSTNSFECLAEANPHPEITWTRPGGSSLHSAVRTEGATLQFLSMSSELNGIFLCEAANRYGRKQAYLYKHVTTGGCSACWTLFSVLLLLNVIAAAIWIYRAKLGSSTESPKTRRAEDEAVNLQTEQSM